MCFLRLFSSLSFFSLHCTHYTKPAEQRQIVRILLMPPIYAIVSFFSYRYFREYIYYVIVRDASVAFSPYPTTPLLGATLQCIH